MEGVRLGALGPIIGLIGGGRRSARQAYRQRSRLQRGSAPAERLVEAVSFPARLPVIAVLAVMISGTAVSASEMIEDVLGGPFITCTGAIAWTETDTGSTRVEPMRLAVRDAEHATAIGLFLSEDEFASHNVWACAGGICTAHSSSRSAVTTNVLRLRHEADLAGEEAVYQLDGVFIVVNARETPIEVESARGVGSFICEEALPHGLVSLSDEDNTP